MKDNIKFSAIFILNISLVTSLSASLAELTDAIAFENTELVEQIASHNDINLNSIISQENPVTPLYWAILRCTIGGLTGKLLDIIKLLVDKGAKPDFKCLGNHTPIFLSTLIAPASVGKFISYFLMSKCENICTYDENLGTTYLHKIIEWDHFDINGTLNNKQSLDINIQDVDNGNTPLHCAVIFNKPKAISALLNHPGIKPNLKNKNSETALHLAVKSYSLESVLALLNFYSTRVFEENKNNQTALDLAKELYLTHKNIIISYPDTVQLIKKIEDPFIAGETLLAIDAGHFNNLESKDQLYFASISQDQLERLAKPISLIQQIGKALIQRMGLTGNNRVISQNGITKPECLNSRELCLPEEITHRIGIYLDLKEDVH